MPKGPIGWGSPQAGRLRPKQGLRRRQKLAASEQLNEGGGGEGGEGRNTEVGDVALQGFGVTLEEAK